MRGSDSAEGTQRRFRWKNLAELLIPFTLGFTPFLWFQSPYVANGNDTTWPFNAAEWFASRLFMWYPRENGGVDSGNNVAGALWHGAEALVQTFHLSHTLHEKLFITIWYMIAAFSMWTSMRLLTGSRAASLVGTLVYLFNPVMMTGALFENLSVSNITTYSILPSLVTVLILTLERRLAILAGASLFGLLSLIASPVGMFPPLQIAVMLFLGAIVVVAWLTDRRPDASRHALLTCVAFGAAFALVNAYWILPLAHFIKATAEEAGGISLKDFNYPDWEDGQSSHSSLFIVARMLGSWDWFYKYNGEWFDAYSQVYLRNPVFIAIGGALVALAFGALRLLKNGELRRRALMLSVAAIVILFFAPGSHLPTGIIFKLVRNLPGLQVLRSPWFVFTQFLPLAYGMLLGFFLGAIALKWRRFAVAVGLSAATLAYGYPLITGEFLKPFREQIPGFVMKYPPYVEAAARYLSLRPGRYTFFPVISVSPNIFPWQDGPIISSSPITDNLTLRPVAYFQPAGAAALSRRPYDLMLQRAYRDILDENVVARSDLQTLGITDIVIQNDAWFDIGFGYQIAPVVWEQAVQRIPGIRKARSFGPWHIYELPYHGKVQATDAVAVGNVRPELSGAWNGLGSHGVALVSITGNAPLPADLQKISHEYVVDPAGTRTTDITRYWSANRSAPLAMLAGNDASNAMPIEGRYGYRPKVFRSAQTRSPYREQTQPIFALSKWQLTHLRAKDAQPVAADRVLDVTTVSASVSTLPSSDNQSLLILRNDSASFVRAAVQLSGSDIVPDQTAAGFVSWSARYGLLTVNLAPGVTTRTIQHAPGDVQAKISSVAADEERPPLLPASFAMHFAGQRATVRLSSHSREAGTIGTMLPILRGAPVDTAPLVFSDVRSISSARGYAAILVEIRSPKGEVSREEFATDPDQPIDLIPAIDAKYRQRWAFVRKSHQYDTRWLLAHRIPQRVEGSTISLWLMLVGSSAGGAFPEFDLRTLSVVATNSYAPTLNEAELGLEPGIARWSGEAADARMPVTSGPGTVELLGQPPSNFEDYSPAKITAYVLHERYAFTTVNNEKFLGEVLSTSRAAISIKVAEDDVRLVQTNAIASVGVPQDGTGGVLTISRDVQSIPMKGRVLTFGFRPGGNQQRVFLRLVAEQGKRAETIAIDPYKPGAQFEGVTVTGGANIALPISGSSLIRQILAQNTALGVVGKLISIDMTELLAARRLPADMRLKRIDLVVDWASEGISLSSLRLFTLAAYATVAALEPRATGMSYSSTADLAANKVAVNGTSISAVRYEVRLSARKPTILAFDEVFNRGWKAVILKPGQADLGGVVGWSNLQYAFAPGLPHFPVNGFENGWLVPPGQDIRVMLVYAPQQLYAVGFIITLGGTIFLLMLMWRARRWTVRE